MKYLNFSVVAVAMLAMVVATSQQSVANPLVDPGFESPLVADGSGVGKWEPFSNGGLNTSEQGTSMPLSGAGHADLHLEDANSFAGFFQDVLNVVPGSPIDWSVWAKELTSENGAGVELRIEYRDSVNDVEVSRTGNLVPASLGATYEQLTLSDTVPAGADVARVVFAIQSFGAGAPQDVFVDDASVSVQQIPEPATLALLGFAGVALATMRRK